MLERALAVLQCKHTDAIVLNTHPDLQVVLHSLNVQVAVVDEHHDLPEGLLKLVVPKPRLQSLPSLRAKVKARREAYIQRQRRKGVL
ncbi:hypothetical protein JAAARDRAFT_350827 [Jaapia argillacea MUCL 33604]|uniref:Uncharacterized protein n=1 Tax=Jaapia argillacea MUCL 33604 TaxID=933084 RepID=A0A067PIU7_9AGAM|nr:hypothetical protein JAAARDRAFT_350827 [Jaapia argillacea MUCL 33604]